jgi:hypothetical protein
MVTPFDEVVNTLSDLVREGKFVISGFPTSPPGIDLPAEFRRELDEASQLEQVHPYMLFEPFTQARINGGVTVRYWGT